MADELANDLIVQTLRTAGTMVRASRRVFRPFGVSEAQFNVLNILARPAVDGITQSELSAILVVDRSNVTGLLDRMEAAGWVRRDAVPDDRRAWRVRLTPAGRRLWEKCAEAYARAVRQVVAPLTAGRMRSTLAVLKDLERGAAGLVATEMDT